jgi:hypothetical protein
MDDAGFSTDAGTSGAADMPVEQSVARYEQRLRAWLGGDMVEKDLAAKHLKMRESPFLFLRATCWRWAERAPVICKKLADAPPVLAIGDAHIENFGLWRDAEGRLVWGVNDFDEAAITPYAFDLVRLATSILLSSSAAKPVPATKMLLEGYEAGLEAPGAFLLEERNWRLRRAVFASEDEQKKFWRDLQSLKPAEPPPRYKDVLEKAAPNAITDKTFYRRVAGAGSLGRPRYVMLAKFNDALINREVKAVAPSCWALDDRTSLLGANLIKAARGPHRSPDPWYDVSDGLLVRRLGANNRKLDFRAPDVPADNILFAMGKEVANIHYGTEGAPASIKAHLAKCPEDWLARAAVKVAEDTTQEWRRYRKSEKG